MFSEADHLAAETPWQYTTADGRTYTARLISQARIVQYNARLVHTKRLVALTTDPEIQDAIWGRAVLRQLRSLYREAFPWRPWMLWRGDPVRRLFRLPPAAFEAARADFFGFLARSRPSTPAPPIPTTAPQLSPS